MGFNRTKPADRLHHLFTDASSFSVGHSPCSVAPLEHHLSEMALQPFRCTLRHRHRRDEPQGFLQKFSDYKLVLWALGCTCSWFWRWKFLQPKAVTIISASTSLINTHLPWNQGKATAHNFCLPQKSVVKPKVGMFDLSI